MTEIAIPAGGQPLPATLHQPPHPGGVVVFVHGSGVDRHDARDMRLAQGLGEAGFATLQPELLDARQACDPCNALDLELHCSRLLQVLDWLEREPWAAGLPLGLFGAGIGAGVALLAAASRPGRIAAVVCRDGRPDSALFRVPCVTAATLMLVEEDGWPYRPAYEALPGLKELVVVPSGSGAFDEPAAIGAVAQHAQRWFARHLARRAD
jgi:putative phosphoribosyl transferase